MGFQTFLAAIESPRLRHIALHWNDVRGTRRMPGWKDIDPAAVAPHLPIIWSWKYDGDTDSFTSRLAGEDIIAILGRNPRGKRMEEFFDRAQCEYIFARNKRVVSEPTFAHERGQVFRYAQRHCLGERIMMPLAADGFRGDGVLGATIYSTDPRAPHDPTPDSFQKAQQTAFFPLD